MSGEKIALRNYDFARIHADVRLEDEIVSQKLHLRETAMSDTEADKDDREETPTGEPPRVIRAEELFAGRREVWIELAGVRYRLRITRRGKLILQK